MSDVRKRVERAERYLQRGKPESALDEFLQILDIDPGNDAVCNTAADICVSLGRNTEAVRLLSAMFDGQCNHGDNSHAALTYKKIARITRPAGEQSLRFAQELAKDQQEALKAFDSAFEAFTIKGRTEQAAEALNGIVAIEPSVENFRKLGNLQDELGQSFAASAAYFRAGEIERDEQAKIVLLKKAFELNKADLNLALAYAGALLNTGNPAAAAEVLSAPANLDGTDKAFKQQISALYGRALLRCHRAAEAAPHLWAASEGSKNSSSEVAEAIIQLAADQSDLALEWARKLELREFKAGRRREFVALVKSLGEKSLPRIELLEYMAEVFNLANREHDYCETLLKLFDLHYAAGNFTQAVDCLDRAAEVDAYESGHQSRFEMLRGKVPYDQLKAVAARLIGAGGAGDSFTGNEDPKLESTTLEDLMLQAQIYLRYGMLAKAREKLDRIRTLFPDQEQASPELRDLFLSAGVLPSRQQPEVQASSSRRDTRKERVLPAPSLNDAPEQPGAGNGSNPRARNSSPDEIGTIAEITRNLYRESSVKSVLFTAVNALGRHCNATRCLAVLSTPGKPPSIAVEFCAHGVQQSDIQTIVKVVGLLQPLSIVNGALEICGRKTRSILKPLRKPLQAVGMDSVLALPLMDGDEHIGIIVLSQSGEAREWTHRDTALLNTISEQAVLAIHNVRLRRLVKDLAVTEEASGLVKRSSYVDVVLAEVRRGLEQNSPLSVMLMSFTGPDGTSIHVPGTMESAIRHVARLVSSNVRQNDITFRYGPLSIAVLLADTPERNALLAAEKLRRVAAVANVPGMDGPLDMSIGVAEAAMQGDSDPVDIVTELINRADRSLEQACLVGNNATEFLPVPLETWTVSA